jgi:hypothetical protein
LFLPGIAIRLNSGFHKPWGKCIAICQTNRHNNKIKNIDLWVVKQELPDSEVK